MDFLIENRLNNSRTWFDEHRDVYNAEVLAPLRALVEALTPTMLSIDPDFTVTPTVNKTISRIWRDTRFSRDKSLFRDRMWITFMRRKKFWEGLPGYYFLFGPEGLDAGIGYYEASAQSMACFREMALHGEKPFLQMRKAYEAQKLYTVRGDRYKRSKFPDTPEELRFWLDLKNLDFGCPLKDPSLLFSSKLADELSSVFLALRPMYDFIAAVEARRPRKEAPEEI